MTDRELLEAAAKAVGLEVICHASYPNGGVYVKGMEDDWNPLTDDGDALRLAVKLKMGVNFDGEKVGANCGRGAVEVFGNDPLAATRRAIVKVAAEIGRSMK
jgi:hypothetical protein